MEMMPNQAIVLLDTLVKELNMTRDSHFQVIEALSVLKALVDSVQKPMGVVK